MEPGIYRGMSFDDYLKIEAINKSNLDYIAQSPAHFYVNCLDPARVRKKPTPAMTLGTAIHCAILEPEKFAGEYCTIDEAAPKRPTQRQVDAKKPSAETVEAIEFWQAFDREASGRELLSPDDWRTCQAIAKSVRKNLVGSTLLESGDPEVVLVWRDPVEHVLCKGRLDWLTTGAIVDFKSTTDAGDKAFSRQVATMEWDVQSAWYHDAMKTLTGDDYLFVFGAVEKSAPYACRFYSAGEEMLTVGRQLYRARLRRYAQCVMDRKWPAYPEEVSELKPPAWRIKEVEESE